MVTHFVNTHHGLSTWCNRLHVGYNVISAVSFHLQFCFPLLISAPSLGVHYFLSLTQWLCLSVTNIVSSFFVSHGIEPYFGHQFSMTKTIQNCFSSNFDLGSLTNKIYSPKFSSVGHWVSHSLWVNDIWARREDPVAYRLVFTNDWFVGLVFFKENNCRIWVCAKWC